MKDLLSGFALARLAASGLLFRALTRNPYGYYTLLRWLVCAVAAYGALTFLHVNKRGWVWTFSVVALLFNPIVPVRLDRQTWAAIDLGVGILMLVSIAAQRQKPRGKPL